MQVDIDFPKPVSAISSMPRLTVLLGTKPVATRLSPGTKHNMTVISIKSSSANIQIPNVLTINLNFVVIRFEFLLYFMKIGRSSLRSANQYSRYFSCDIYLRSCVSVWHYICGIRFVEPYTMQFTTQRNMVHTVLINFRAVSAIHEPKFK